MASRNGDPSTEQYFRDIRSSGGLSSAEERALSQRIKDGDEQALRELVQANLLFVITIAKKYENKGLPLNDLISIEGLQCVRIPDFSCFPPASYKPLEEY